MKITISDDTAKIYLRQLDLNDVNENYCTWLNDTEVNQYLESRYFHHSIESIKEFVSHILADPDHVFLAIVHKHTHQHIGNIKLGPINRFHRIAEIGLIIGERSCWGKGYASQAIRLLSGYAFNTLKLHKLTAGCYANNVGSLKAFQKANFNIEGKLESHYCYIDHYVDAIRLGQINPVEL